MQDTNIELNAKYLECLESRNFIEAGEIMKEIKSIEEKQNDSYINQIIMEYEKETSSINEDYKDSVMSIKEKYGNEELRIRTKISDLFHNTQISHVNRLIEFEKDFLARYCSILESPNPICEEISVRAKHQAHLGFFNDAERLADQAKATEAETRMKNRFDITNEFLLCREQVIMHQKEEIQAISSKLERSLYNIETKMNNELDGALSSAYREIESKFEYFRKKIFKEQALIKNREKYIKTLKKTHEESKRRIVFR